MREGRERGPHREEELLPDPPEPPPPPPPMLEVLLELLPPGRPPVLLLLVLGGAPDPPPPTWFLWYSIGDVKAAKEEMVKMLAGLSSLHFRKFWNNYKVSNVIQVCT